MSSFPITPLYLTTRNDTNTQQTPMRIVLVYVHIHRKPAKCDAQPALRTTYAPSNVYTQCIWHCIISPVRSTTRAMRCYTHTRTHPHTYNHTCSLYPSFASVGCCDDAWCNIQFLPLSNPLVLSLSLLERDAYTHTSEKLTNNVPL